MFRVVALAAATLAVSAPASAEEFPRPPAAQAEANGATTVPALGSGCAQGRSQGVCRDTVWPPAGLGAPLPVTPGSTVLLRFDRPVDPEHAQLGGAQVTFAAESPSVWRVTVPGALGDGLLSFFVRWQDDESRGDQVYAIPLTTAAELVDRRRRAATVTAHTAGTLRLSLVRNGRTLRTRRFAVRGPGTETYKLRRARGAHLVVRFTPPDGPALKL